MTGLPRCRAVRQTGLQSGCQWQRATTASNSTQGAKRSHASTIVSNAFETGFDFLAGA